MQLDPAAAAAGFRLKAHDTIASTNTQALTLAQAADNDRLWVTARMQTAGRGRRGHAWISRPGNLYTSLLLRDPAPPGQAPQLAFVAGLAVFDAIVTCAPELQSALALKWPNDVLCGDAKLAGILIESERIAGALAVAIGIGVNCAHHPAETPYPATDLAAAGGVASPARVFGALSAAMARRLSQWQRGAGFAAIRADWLARARGLGAALRARLPDRELAGTFETLDAAGHLILRLADGRRQAITAGEIFDAGAGAATGSIT